MIEQNYYATGYKWTVTADCKPHTKMYVMGKRKATSTNSLNRKTLVDYCGMVYATDILGGRWKLLILYKLDVKTLRYNEIKKLIPAITDRMLTLHLQELETNGLITRTAFAEVPPRVEYRLTESSQQLIPVWRQLERWGLRHRLLMETGTEIKADTHVNVSHEEHVPVLI